MTDDTGRSQDPTRRTMLLGFGGAFSAAFAAGAPPAAAQMAQGHREARPGTSPLAEIRVIERSNLLSGRLAGLLLADQGAEVFVERAGPSRRRTSAWPSTTPISTVAAAAAGRRGGRRLRRHRHRGRRRAIRAGAAPILLRIMAVLPGDEAYGYLPHDCSEDLIKAVVGFFSNMSVSGPILNRPVIYTPLPLPSIYCAVNGAVAAVSALVDRLRTGLGREIIASRLAGGLSAIGALSMTSKGLPDFLEPIIIGGLPPGLTPEQFHTFVADAIREPERQMWLERRFAPFSAPYRARDGRWILPMAGPNARLSRRLLEAMGLWDQALTTGAVFVNPYDPANIAEARRNMGDSLSLGFAYTSRLAGTCGIRLRHPHRGGVGALPRREWHRGHHYDDLGGMAARRRCAHGRSLRRDPRDRGRADRADELDA